MLSTITRRAATAALIAIVISACGGSDDDAGTPADDSSADDASASADEAGVDESASSDDDVDGQADEAEADSGVDDTGDDTGESDIAGEVSSGTYGPGEIFFRSINLLDQPVDIYVRTTGLVEAFPIEMGVAPDAVTEYAPPPEGGSYIVTRAGAGDPTCVTQCDHFVAELSGVFGEGPSRTVILYEDPFSGPRAFDLSEEPDSAESAAASANLLQPADPTTGLVFPVGIALDDDVFGFRVGFEGVAGCVETIDQANILVGGNQTPAYAYPGDSAGLLFFEQPDQSCESPVADPIELTGGPGTRTLVVLEGSTTDLRSVVVELSGSVAATSTDAQDDAADDTGDTGEAEELPEGREEFVDAVLSDAPAGTDEQCVTDIVNQLSDADIAIIIENIDAEDVPPGLSPEGLDTLSGILDCAPA